MENEGVWNDTLTPVQLRNDTYFKWTAKTRADRETRTFPDDPQGSEVGWLTRRMWPST